jgi:hypothetical protein
MIIKAYELMQTPTDKIHIFDHVTDVIVDTNIYSSDFKGVEYVPSVIHTGENVTSDQERCHVDFTRDGIRHRLIVFGHAYICSDDGKTIQKVSTGN